MDFSTNEDWPFPCGLSSRLLIGRSFNLNDNI